MKMNKVLTYFISFVFIFIETFASTGKLKKKDNGFDFWKLKSISGLLSLEGNYRSGIYNLPGYFSDERISTYITGQLDINTSSIFLHPNFFQLDANFSYSPAKNLDLYIISPDNSEINTTERVDLIGIFFSERMISLNPYFYFNHTFSRREFTTNIESFYTNYGSRLFSPNPFLPFSINVAQNNWDENEFQTGRSFNTNQFMVNSEFNKSISNISTNRLSIDYFNYKRNYSSSSLIHNKAVNLSLINSLILNSSNNFNISSLISSNNQTGSQALNRFMVNENLYSNLIFGFSIYGRYQYYKITQDLIESRQNDVEGRIEHQLFESLRSHLSYNYVTVSQTFYDEKINCGEIGFDYIKKIPSGSLRLNYSYTLSSENRTNVFGTISILDESKILTDGAVNLLNNPFVDRNSIIVKNAAGTIIFQESFDYVLIPRGIYFEIQRVPGSQIADGEIVLVSYKAEQQPSLDFDSKLNRYGAGISVLNNFVEFYFNGANQNYTNISEVNSDYLKTLNQKLYGIRISYEYLDIGVEYEDYRSNITPYTSSRYFFRLFRQPSDNLIATINSGYRIYNLMDDNSIQKFADVSLMLTYLLCPNSRIAFEGNYIFQDGYQIDLNLSSLKLEYITSFRQIDFIIGYENYNRKLLSDESKYSRVFAKVLRRF